MRVKNSLHAMQGWRDFQFQQIDDNLESTNKVQPLFPGSMLFNQVLIPAEQSVSVAMMPAILADTRDVELQYCTELLHSNEHKNRLILDLGCADYAVPKDALINLISGYSWIDRIAVFNESSVQLVKNLLKKADLLIPIEIIEPDWSSAFALHACYRSARHLIFIDSMRVLDAAYTGCSCTLLASTEFKSQVSFGLLLRQLAQVNCLAFDSNGKLESDDYGSCAFYVAENSIGDVEQYLSDRSSVDVNGDWLERVSHNNSKPIIQTNRHHSAGFKSTVLDKKTRLARKLRKLQENPDAFFADSENPVLKNIARLFSQK